MRLTVAEAFMLPDHQLWHLGPVTVSGYLYANSPVSCLVDQQGESRGVLLLTNPTKELSICERLLDSDCCGFAIGGGTILFAGPTEVTGQLARLHFPMFPLTMGGITEIVHRGKKAAQGQKATDGPKWHTFSVAPGSVDSP
jgi:hypothetical protein